MMKPRGEEAWKMEGACKGSDPNDWTEREEWETREQFKERVARVGRVCKGCEVEDECLVWALRYGEKGIWAGTTRSQRARMRTRARKAG